MMTFFGFSPLDLFSFVCVAGWLAMLIRVQFISSENVRLSAIQPLQSAVFPRVSVLVPACNEAAKVEPAMRSLLAQDYPNCRIIAINDRSTDDTPEILNRLASEFLDKLTVLHIRDLPAGWLGKNHANQKGYELIQSTKVLGRESDFILFTDADVVFGREVISKAVSYAIEKQVQHLVVYPKMLTENVFEESFIALFAMLFMWKFNPRGARNPKNKRDYIGVGAFNFISRRLYERIGTHEVLKGEVGDDVMLGYYVKQQNEATHVLNSEGEVRVRWREGLRDSLRAVVRSAFPGINFSWTWVGIAVVGTLGGLLAPYWLLLTGGNIERSCAAISLVILLGCYILIGKSFVKAVMCVVLHPVMAMLFLYALVRSAVQITWQGGVEWRGTFYPVSVLRAKQAALRKG